MQKLLKKTLLDTPLGAMLAIASDEGLYLLEFADRPNLGQRIERLCRKTGATLCDGNAEPIQSINKELASYFKGELKQFKTPRIMCGTPFQESVWHALTTVNYGDTRSYAQIARLLHRDKAYRAVAQANNANYFSIVIPCHRVVGAAGQLTGYNGGLTRKEWLLNHEKTCAR